MTAKKTNTRNFFLRVLLTVIAFGMGIVLSGFLGLMLLQYSVSTTSLTIPDFRKQDLISAINLASRIGLQVEVARVEHHPESAANEVLEQDPVPGTEAKRGRKIKVVVNGSGVEGPLADATIPTTNQETNLSKIPDVREITLDEAKNLLEENGYQLGRVVEVTHNDIPQGMVISQNPPAESTLPLGSQVNLLVSKGGAVVEQPPEKATVPDLIGLKIEEAKRLLMQMNLGVGRIEEVVIPERNPGVVIGQIPESGQQVATGQKINLQVVKALQDLQDLRLRFALPDAKVPITVKIVVKDELGERVVYEEQHQGGETVELSSRTKGKGKVLIYLNGYYYWEKDL